MRSFGSIFMVLGGVLCFFGFRGTVSHSILVAVFVFSWLLIFGVSRSFRNSVKIQWGHAKARFVAFSSADRGIIPWKSAFLFIGLPMGLLCLLNGRNISSYDNYGIQLTAASLILNGSPDISSLAGHRIGNVVNCNGLDYPVFCDSTGMKSGTPPGVLAFSLPFFLLGRLLGADLHRHHTLWRLSKWTASWVAAFCLTLFFIIALRVGPLTPSLLATVFVGSGSALLAIVGQGLWSHDGVTTGLMISLFAIFVLPRTSPMRGIFIGLGWSFMFASRLTAATLIAPMALWLLATEWRNFLISGLAALLGLVPWALYSWRAWGSPLGPQALAVGGQVSVFSMGILPEGLLGLSVSPASGFFIFQPWALLLLLYLWSPKAFPVKASNPTGWQWLFLVMGVGQWILFASFQNWSGQKCWGSRYLTEIVPLAGLAVVPILATFTDRSLLKRLAWTLGGIAFAIQLNGVLLRGGEWYYHPLYSYSTPEKRCLDWRDPAFLYPIPQWLLKR